MKISEFIHLAGTCELSKLEIHSFIEKATDNFNIEKLTLLLNDIEYEIFIVDEDLQPNSDEVQKRMTEYRKMGKDIPFIPQLKIKTLKGEILLPDSKNVIDIKKMFPEIASQMFCYYELKKFVEGKINLEKKNEKERNESTELIKENPKKYYSDNDFALLIDELLKKQMFEVADFLEYHFSHAFIANSMSKFNWLTSFRKNLMQRFTPPNNITTMGYDSNENPSQINYAYLWERNKNMQLVKEVDERHNKRGNKNTSTKNKPELSISQVALIFCYEGKIITRENGNQIAKEYGHNSGEKLFQKFTFYSSAQNRKGKPSPATPKKFQNKITLLESVIEKLSKEAKSRATDELNTLKTLFSNSDI
jgi:hypothetical protein